MIFLVEDALFAPGYAHDVDLVALLRNAFHREHTLFILADLQITSAQQLTNAKRPHFEKWMKTLGGKLRKEIGLIMEGVNHISSNATTRGNAVVLVRENPSSGLDEVELEKGVLLASSPLQCLVENAMNDRAFLLQCMPPDWRETLRNWETKGALLFENGGGLGTMKVVVRTKAINMPWRISHVAIFDHDGVSAGLPNPESRRVGTLFSKNGMGKRFHRLHRRCQESYLPKESVEHLITQNQDVSDYFSMNVGDRAFKKPPDALKKVFVTFQNWDDAWFERDGHWPEMKQIAEMIAAAM